MDPLKTHLNALRAELNHLHADDGILRRMCLTMEKINNILMPILKECRCEHNKMRIKTTADDVHLMKREYQQMKNQLKSNGETNEIKIIRNYQNSLENKMKSQHDNKMTTEDDNKINHEKHVINDNNNKCIEFTCDENKVCIKSSKSEENVTQSKQKQVKNNNKKKKVKSEEKIHSKSNENYEKLFKCPWNECNKKFSTMEILMIHMDFHNNIKKYSCDSPECNSLLFTLSELKSHLKIHDNNNNLVEDDSKTYNNEDDDEEKFIKIYGEMRIRKIWTQEEEPKINKRSFIYIIPECDLKNENKTSTSSGHEEKRFDFTLKEPHQKRLKINPINNTKVILKKNLCPDENKSPANENINEIDGKLFKCPWNECNKSYSSMKILMIHMDFHNDIKKYSCGSIGCKRILYSLRELQSHLKSDKNHMNDVSKGNNNENDDEEKLIKAYGGMRVTNIGEQKDSSSKKSWIHIKPEADGRYKCSWPGCNVLLKQKYSLEKHKSIHTGEKKYKCDWPQCDKGYDEKTKLEVHQMKHTGIYKFYCEWPGCEYKTVYNKNFKAHQAIHSVTPSFHCNFPGCGQGFNTRARLKGHHLREHTVRPQYECPKSYCHKKFTSERSLKHHLASSIVHYTHRLAPFVCCNRNFKSYMALRVHTRRTHNS